MDNMKIKLKNKVVFVEFPNRKELTRTMGRLGEFYESANKHIRGKYFDLDTFIDAFMDSDGNISYYNDWSGYNVPGNIVIDFLDTFEYMGLSSREIDLIDDIDTILFDMDYAHQKFSDGEFYLIAYMAGDTPTIEHELCHAAYYLNKDYKKQANKLIKALNPVIVESMTSDLIKMGYNKSVCKDEINAYLATASLTFLKNRFGTFAWKSIVKPFQDLAEPIIKEYHV